MLSKEKHPEAERGHVRMSQKCSPLALFSTKVTSCSTQNISHQHSTISISSPRQRQCSQITILQTNIWSHRQNPRRALTPSHGGHRFPSGTEASPALGRGLRAHGSVTHKEEFFTEEIETSWDLFVPPLGRDSVCHPH